MTISEALKLHKLDWKPIDKYFIEVVFIGHFDDNYAHMEHELNTLGLLAIRRRYDKKANKTITLYKRTKNV